MVVIYTFVPFVLLLSSLSIIYIHIVQMEYIISFALGFHVTFSHFKSIPLVRSENNHLQNEGVQFLNLRKLCCDRPRISSGRGRTMK